MYSYGSPHMAAQKQDDQYERTFSSYVRIRDVVLKTYLGRWTIGRSGERGSGISMVPAWYDDDDIYIYINTDIGRHTYVHTHNNIHIYIYIYITVLVVTKSLSGFVSNQVLTHILTITRKDSYKILMVFWLYFFQFSIHFINCLMIVVFPKTPLNLGVAV